MNNKIILQGRYFVRQPFQIDKEKEKLSGVKRIGYTNDHFFIEELVANLYIFKVKYYDVSEFAHLLPNEFNCFFWS